MYAVHTRRSCSRQFADSSAPGCVLRGSYDIAGLSHEVQSKDGARRQGRARTGASRGHRRFDPCAGERRRLLLAGSEWIGLSGRAT